MTRVVSLVTLIVAVLAAPLVAEAQQAGKVYRIGHVMSGTRDQNAVILRALEDRLKQLGYVEGQNVRFEHRFADGQVERLPALMADIVRLNVDAIVAGSNQTVALAKRATTTIPIVMTVTADPVGAGFVASLARPGGNITGLAVDVTPDIAGKRLALLKDAAPRVAHVAVLWEPGLSWAPRYWEATQRAAAPLRLALRSYELRHPADLDAALDRIAREGTDGLFVFLSSLTHRRAADITAFALRHRLPAVYGTRAFAERGGLLSYGPDLVDPYRRAATYLDKIFRGASPADLPVEQPVKFEFLVNLTTAKALGLTIPPSVLTLAAVGNLIGPGPHARVQHDRHSCRLNVALVGRTGKGRKGTAWSTPRHLLAQVDPAWAARRVTTGLSSGEGLVYHVRDARRESLPVRERGRVVGHEDVEVDAGEPDKRLLVIEPELAVVLRVIAREANILSGLIRQAWDAGDLGTLTKHSPLRATGTHVSLIGHITEEEVRRYLTETERASGFANRFLWLLVKRSKALPDGAPVPDTILAPILDAFREVVAFSKTVSELGRDAEARALWREVYPTLSEGEPGMVGAILNRAEAQVLRLSTLYAVLDRSAEIGVAHLRAGLALWDYAEQSARRIFGRRLGVPLADVLLEALRTRGPLTASAISGLFGRHRSAEELHQALDLLRDLGLVERRAEETGGRPATLWIACTECETYETSE